MYLIFYLSVISRINLKHKRIYEVLPVDSEAPSPAVTAASSGTTPNENATKTPDPMKTALVSSSHCIS
ncbi:hypothetical protein AB6A40_010517 [Gnathostoma spinigerum]|uniref:Uncharacterized protein n=1 Tax=Gnathostoma spinigerum TaxID=75299 RepID=A0ABD6EVH6_9BILA